MGAFARLEGIDGARLNQILERAQPVWRWSQRVARPVARFVDVCFVRFAEAWIAALWFGVVLCGTLWMWGGLEPLVFPATDEAVNRLAAILVRTNGHPAQNLPFPDPEDLAHMRAWLTVGDNALPVYPPVTYYVYGYVTRLGKFGFLLISALPAGAVAAFAAGTARLLPRGRRWLALLAPTLGTPALYWLLRPWINMSFLLVCLCWGFYFSTRWREKGDSRWLAPAMFAFGLGCAARPDFAAHVMSAVLLFSIAALPARWRPVLISATIAGAAALGVNLILNKATTGHAFRGVYQMVMEQEASAPAGGGSRFAIIKTLLLPLGLPPADQAWNFFGKYWLKLGAMPVLLALQLALIPLWWKASRISQVALALGLLVIAVAMFSHVELELFGASAPVALVNYSITRYWTPSYLFAALPPLLYFGRSRFRSVAAAGSLLVLAVGVYGLHWICIGQPTSFSYVASFGRNNTSWLRSISGLIPSDAIVYSKKNDRALWSGWQMGVIESPTRTAASMERGLAAGVPVFIAERRFLKNRGLIRLLESHGVKVETVNAKRDVYRLVSPNQPEPAPRRPRGRGRNRRR